MGTLAGFAQQIDCSACDYFATMAKEGINQLLKIENLWLTINQCHHVDAEHALQLGLRKEVVENHFSDIGAFNFNDDAHAVFV